MTGRASSSAARAVTSIDAAAPRQLPERVVRQRATIQLASLRELPADDSPAVPAPPQPERRRNIFSRFVHGIFHGTTSVALKSDVP